MSKKSSLGALSMLTAMAAISSEHHAKQYWDNCRPSQNNAEEQQQNAAQQKQVKSKQTFEEIINSRLRECNIDGKIVYAATKKAALKKASKI
jgi:hypothetical protein